jgi:hypothetical protein
LDPAQVSPIFESRFEPGTYNRQSVILRHHSLSKRNHIGIIVLARQPRCLNIPADSTTHSFYAIGSHRFTIAGAAEHYSSLSLTTSHGMSYGTYEERVVDGLLRTRTKIFDLMSEVYEESFYLLFVFKSSVVGSDCDFHLPITYLPIILA